MKASRRLRLAVRLQTVTMDLLGEWGKRDKGEQAFETVGVCWEKRVSWGKWERQIR